MKYKQRSLLKLVGVLYGVRSALHGAAGSGGTDIKEMRARVGHRELEVLIELCGTTCNVR